MLQIARLNSARPDFAERVRELRSPPPAMESVRERVAEVIEKIRRGGDSALLECVRQYDNFPAQNAGELEIGPAERESALRDIPPNLRKALEFAAGRIRLYHERQKPQSREFTDEHGNILGEKICPVSRAVIYAPGGKASYPSSVLMGVIPAKIAGTPEVIVSTPDPGAATLAAAAIAGADRVFRVGGAHAVAAFALGTESIPRADKIAGPGGAFVTEAKRQLCGAAGFDALAGPSEVFIVADDSANPSWVAADMLAQAEHDEMAQCILATPSAALEASVFEKLGELTARSPRAEIVRESLRRRGALAVTADLRECAALANDFAPEHLQLMGARAEALAEEIRNAGAVFIGERACVPMGDYCAGTNHILPTGGGARFSSGLGVWDFVRRMETARLSESGARILAEHTATLAEAEGFPGHALSARLRG